MTTPTLVEGESHPWYIIIQGAKKVLPMRMGGSTRQLDLPSLTPLCIAGCGQLQLGVPHWAASVDYC